MATGRRSETGVDERVREAIRDAGWKPSLLVRRAKLWDLKARGLTMVQVAEALDIAERVAWNDWKRVNELLATIDLSRISALRERISAKKDHLYTICMSQINAALKTQQPGAPKDQRVPVDPRWVTAADKILHEQAELYGLIDRTHHLHLENSTVLAPFASFMERHGLARDEQGRFASIIPIDERITGTHGGTGNGTGNGDRALPPSE
jgi:hypothetical protein